ncbi:MAG: hypothetical protein HY650_07080 [Acidobacteria bacterium]|nr:hypothetical protein [Acidobacteriota bacterium]
MRLRFFSYYGLLALIPLLGLASPLPDRLGEAGAPRTGLSCIKDEHALRAAIQDAQPGGTIAIDAGRITLTDGELVIDKDLTISGKGAALTILSGGNTSRIFFICPGDPGATTGPPARCPIVHLSSMTIADGMTKGGDGGSSYLAGSTTSFGGAGGGAAGMGGGLFINGGTVTIDRVILLGNQAIGSSVSILAASSGPCTFTLTVQIRDDRTGQIGTCKKTVSIRLSHSND